MCGAKQLTTPKTSLQLRQVPGVAGILLVGLNRSEYCKYVLQVWFPRQIMIVNQVVRYIAVSL